MRAACSGHQPPTANNLLRENAAGAHIHDGVHGIRYGWTGPQWAVSIDTISPRAADLDIITFVGNGRSLSL